MKRTIALLLVLVTLLSLVACGSKSTPADNQPQHTHSFGEWTTTKAPSCTESGEQERTCSCGEKQTQTVAALGHDYVDFVCTRCGDVLDADKLSEADNLIKQEKYEDAYELLKGISANPKAQEKLANFFLAPKTVSEKYDGEDWGKNQYYYNSMGNVSVWVETYKDGKTYENHFKYAGNGNLLEGYPYMSQTTKYSYEYSDGKISKETINRYGDETYIAYEYNEKGLPVKAVSTGEREGTYKFEYEYYPSGKIKSVSNNSMWLYGAGWFYDENGNVTRVNVNFGEYEIEMKFTYGEFGLAKAELTGYGVTVGDFVYTYNTDGVLTKMTATEYEYSGAVHEVHEYTFSDFTLIYSENASVIERAKTTCYLPVNEFALCDLVDIIS